MEKPGKWSVDEFGMEKTFCCIHAIPRDFAKFGLLFLNNGKVGENQVISAEYLQKMITPTKHSDGIYGMGIWVNNDNPIKHYYFLGLMGQYIIMIPEKNMIIVKTGSYSDNPKNDRGRPDQAKFMVNEAAKLFN
jgi:CubicO group peptidase (beta-lactamase class C family)